MPRPAKVPTPPPAGCLWTPEAARYIGLTVSTLHNYRHLGKGPESFPVGRKLAYPIDGLKAWLDAQRRPASSPEQERDSRPPEPRLSRRKKAGAKAVDDEELQPAA